MELFMEVSQKIRHPQIILS